jgi:4a-hydroxytetrahydrobiopterin dehydratase
MAAQDRKTPSLKDKRCVPCTGGVPPLTGPALAALLAELGNGWKLVAEHHIEKEFKFKDFREALSFTNLVGALAEEQGHHPDILLAWGRVVVTIWTHKIDGLTESDFVFAAKTDALAAKR